MFSLRRGRLRACADVVLRALRPHAGVLSQIGDLAASLVKRDCGVKDFGKIFPGHGGVMDRLDGILFATLACHLFFRVMG